MIKLHAWLFTCILHEIAHIVMIVDTDSAPLVNDDDDIMKLIKV